MKRKIIKGILFFGGLAVATAAMALFFPRVMASRTFEMMDVFLVSIVGGAGVILAAFGLLMHAKDVRETKKGLSVFCSVLAIFWLVTGGLNLIAGVVLLIIF